MISHETKVGDEVEYGDEKGTVTAIMGNFEGKVAVVEIPVTSVKTVYVSIPNPPEPEIEPPTVED